MKRSAFNDLISQTYDIFKEHQQKFFDADKNFQESGNGTERLVCKLIKDMQFYRQDAAFCALNAITTARDILEHLGYIEED